MCIVDKITFPTCTHKTHILLFPCMSGFSIFQKICNANSTVIRRTISSTQPHEDIKQSHCPTCFLITLKTIRTDYAKCYLELEKDARSLGWSNSDIQGSLMEMQLEMDEAIAEWRSSCGQEEEDEREDEEVKLDIFAESIRFQFGPVPILDDPLTPPGTPFHFSAGNGITKLDKSYVKSTIPAKKTLLSAAMEKTKGWSAAALSAFSSLRQLDDGCL